MFKLATKWNRLGFLAYNCIFMEHWLCFSPSRGCLPTTGGMCPFAVYVDNVLINTVAPLLHGDSPTCGSEPGGISVWKEGCPSGIRAPKIQMFRFSDSNVKLYKIRWTPP